jgi:hypothetical protein
MPVGRPRLPLGPVTTDDWERHLLCSDASPMRAVKSDPAPRFVLPDFLAVDEGCDDPSCAHPLEGDHASCHQPGWQSDCMPSSAISGHPHSGRLRGAGEEQAPGGVYQVLRDDAVLCRYDQYWPPMRRDCGVPHHRIASGDAASSEPAGRRGKQTAGNETTGTNASLGPNLHPVGGMLLAGASRAARRRGSGGRRLRPTIAPDKQAQRERRNNRRVP